MIQRAQRRGRYEQLYGVRIVTGHNPRTRQVYVATAHGSDPVPLDELSPEDRRLLFRRTPQGLEPLWVWLSVNGLPKRPHSWEDTFDAANRRIAEAWLNKADPEGRLGKAEREQVRRECPLWATPHMCRHSFALKWFSILSLLEERRLKGFSPDEIEDFRDQLGDIWLQLAVLLGHRHPDTTRDHYLEPFTGLQISYLMALLDDDEKAGVDTLVRIFAQHGVFSPGSFVLAPLERVALAPLLTHVGDGFGRVPRGTDCSGPTLDRVTFRGCPGTEAVRCRWGSAAAGSVCSTEPARLLPLTGMRTGGRLVGARPWARGSQDCQRRALPARPWGPIAQRMALSPTSAGHGLLAAVLRTTSQVLWSPDGVSEDGNCWSAACGLLRWRGE
ncbi:hypothetical protein OH809_15505 [Streptomyces sp. NBC_00873]|uniref:hypothetical protein n=1 Tax=Streptomyces sp. NBC_00873 TaxID=2975852 RepID=UPI0038674E02|nr:hypothetical protein OH809_15505 [Streptomyces sp. NBC_00873]